MQIQTRKILKIRKKTYISSLRESLLIYSNQKPYMRTENVQFNQANSILYFNLG